MTRTWFSFAISTCIAACASSNMGPTYGPAASMGAHRMVQVVDVPDRAVLLEDKNKWIHDALVAQGVADSTIGDRNVVLGRLFCCRTDPPDMLTTWIYVPPGMDVKVEDYLEIRLGSLPANANTSPAVISTAVSVRTGCGWYPKGDRLHKAEGNLFIACNWMAAEGWKIAWLGSIENRAFQAWYRLEEPRERRVSSAPSGDAEYAQGGYSDTSVSPSGVRFIKDRRVLSVTPLAAPTLQIAVSDKGLWVLNSHQVAQIDSSTGAVLQQIDVGASDMLAGYAAESIWVADTRAGRIDRYDSGTGKKIASISLPDPPAKIVEAEGASWVSSLDKGFVSRVDPITNQVTKEIRIGKWGGTVLAAFGAVWATDERKGIVRIDPRTAEVTNRFSACSGPTGLAASKDALWVVCTGDGKLAKFDPSSKQVAMTIPLLGKPFNPATDGKSIWYRDVSGANVFELDPVTGVSVIVHTGASRVFGPEFAFGSIWVTDEDTGTLWHIDVGD